MKSFGPKRSIETIFFEKSHFSSEKRLFDLYFSYYLLSSMTNVKEQIMGLIMCTDNFCGRYSISFVGPNKLLKTTFSEKIYLTCGENHLAHFFAFYRI